MAYTVNDIITSAMRKINIIDETQSPSAEQGVVGLEVLNEMLANWAADGVHLGWFPCTNPANTAPLQIQDIEAVKCHLAVRLANHYGFEPSPTLLAQAEGTWTRLVKLALQYSDADMSELPRAQGPRWSPGGFGF